MRHALMFSIILIGCKTKQTDALNAFLAAECRLLTDPECIDSQRGSCGNVVYYASQEACEDARRDALQDCAEDVSAALESLEELDRCISTLATFDCASPVCTDATPVYNAGDCAVITSTIEDTCL